MLSITLGPLALPLAPVLLLASVLGASGVAAWLARRAPHRGAAHAASADAGPPTTAAASDTMVLATLGGLVVARVAHLAQYSSAYLADPLSAVDVRDGGWSLPAGLAAGLAWLGWRAFSTPHLRTPLAGGATAGLLLWFAATGLAGLRDTPPLPDVTLATRDGTQALTLAAAARGRPVVVNLWASWCAPCRQEMPALAAAQRTWPQVGFLFVNQGEAPEAVERFLRREGLALDDVLLDRAGRLGPAVGSRGLPTTLFYDARGRRVDAHFGVLNAASLDARLRALPSAP